MITRHFNISLTYILNQLYLLIKMDALCFILKEENYNLSYNFIAIKMIKNAFKSINPLGLLPTLTPHLAEQQ